MKVAPKSIISSLFLTVLAALVWLSATAWLQYRSVEAEFRYHVPENTIWAAAQTEIELGRFLLAIEPVANGGPMGDAQTIEKQFNIFWSRADLYRHGTLFDRIKSDPILSDQATGILDALNQVDPLIAKIVSGDASAARKASSLLVPFVKSFRKLTVASLNADRLERERLVFAQSNAETILNQSAIATGALVFILLMYLLYSERHATFLLTQSRDSELALLRQADQMEILAAKARKGSEAKSDFLAMMSHDLRTPMNAIIGYNDILSETKLDAEQKSYISAIMLACNNMLALINDILDLTRLESGKMERREAAFSLHEELSSVAKVVKVIAECHGNTVKVEVDPTLSKFIVGDSERLTQVLTNLAGNAAKFTRGGSITLSATRGHEANRIRYQVSDTGRGIPEEMRTRLFKPFEQGENGRAAGKNSSGLGLAISDRIVRLLGGEIVCDSQEGKGTTFYFDLTYLPTEPADSPAKVTDMNSMINLLAGRRVLIADDTPANLLVATAILEKSGMICTPVSDGTSALECAANNDFDIMFIDIQMPDISGIQVASAIRLMSGDRARTPLVALTAQSFQRDRERALACGFDAFLSKPIRAADLQNIVFGLLSHAEISSNDAPINSALNEGAFNDLLEAVGPELLPQLIGRFELDVNEQLETLMRFHTKPATIEVTALAHKLSGLLSQFGADSAARLAKNIEENEPDSRTSTDLEQLADASRNCLRLIRTLLRQKNGGYAEMSSVPQSSLVNQPLTYNL